jgi:hypothetical protein
VIALVFPIVLLMSAPEAATGPTAAPRVYFAPIAAGPGADVGTISVFEQRLLSSARRHREVQVVGAQDVQSLLDHEATRQQGGCDEGGITCAAELAGALDASRMVTGQLGRVGSTWVLSLTLIERGTLNVIGRSSRQRKGDTPEELLNDLDGMLDELMGAAASADATPTVAPWSTIGTAVMGVGIAGLVVGAGSTAATWVNFNVASGEIAAASSADADTIRTEAQQLGTVLNTTAVVGLAVGAGVAVVGGAIVLLTGQEEQ